MIHKTPILASVVPSFFVYPSPKERPLTALEVATTPTPRTHVPTALLLSAPICDEIADIVIGWYEYRGVDPPIDVGGYVLIVKENLCVRSSLRDFKFGKTEEPRLFFGYPDRKYVEIS